MAIPMAQHGGQLVDIGGEAVGAGSLGGGHTASLAAYPTIPLTFLTQSY
jgi:hypothetical protein